MTRGEAGKLCLFAPRLARFYFFVDPLPSGLVSRPDDTEAVCGVVGFT